MYCRFNYDDTANPAVIEVEGVEADLEKFDEGVVSTCHDYEWNHVGSGKDATPSA